MSFRNPIVSYLYSTGMTGKPPILCFKKYLFCVYMHLYMPGCMCGDREQFRADCLLPSWTQVLNFNTSLAGAPLSAAVSRLLHALLFGKWMLVIKPRSSLGVARTILLSHLPAPCPIPGLRTAFSIHPELPAHLLFCIWGKQR